MEYPIISRLFCANPTGGPVSKCGASGGGVETPPSKKFPLRGFTPGRRCASTGRGHASHVICTYMPRVEIKYHAMWFSTGEWERETERERESSKRDGSAECEFATPC